MSKISNKYIQKLADLYKGYAPENEYKPGDTFEDIKDKMSNEDYDLSQKLLQYYGQQNNLNAQLDYSNNLIEQQRHKALQENSIARQKALKYLPEYQRMQGMGGLGVSQSSIIKANNDFNNNLNTINSDANSRLTDLLEKYQLNSNDLEKNYYTDAESIRNKYELARENELNNLYTSFLNKLDPDRLEFDSLDELDAEYNKIKEKITDPIRQASMETYIDSYKKSFNARESNRVAQEASGIINSKALELMDSNGKISQSAKTSLINLLDQDYKSKLTNDDYNSLKSQIEQYLTTTPEEEQLYSDQNYVLNQFDADISGAISMKNAGKNSFGNFRGSNISDSTQNQYVDKILDETRKGNIKNGDIIDFNYGVGTKCYVYYNGYWYPTTKSANKNIKMPDIVEKAKNFDINGPCLI